MEQTILRKDAIAYLHSGQPFDMVFVTCDRKRGTGGDFITVESWLKVYKEDKIKISVGTSELTPAAAFKDPHHKDNGTVNIFNPGNSGAHITTVHYDLIQFFNGKRVIN